MCADEFKEESQRFCWVIRDVTLFDLTFVAVVEVFGVSGDFRMVGRIVMLMDEPSFSSLFPVIRISSAIRTQPDIYESSLMEVEAELERRCSSSP